MPQVKCSTERKDVLGTLQTAGLISGSSCLVKGDHSDRCISTMASSKGPAWPMCISDGAELDIEREYTFVVQAS